VAPREDTTRTIAGPAPPLDRIVRPEVRVNRPHEGTRPPGSARPGRIPLTAPGANRPRGPCGWPAVPAGTGARPSRRPAPPARGRDRGRVCNPVDRAVRPGPGPSAWPARRATAAARLGRRTALRSRAPGAGPACSIAGRAPDRPREPHEWRARRTGMTTDSARRPARPPRTGARRVAPAEPSRIEARRRGPEGPPRERVAKTAGTARARDSRRRERATRPRDGRRDTRPDPRATGSNDLPGGLRSRTQDRGIAAAGTGSTRTGIARAVMRPVTPSTCAPGATTGGMSTTTGPASR
jgi:hypothetical protein